MPVGIGLSVAGVAGYAASKSSAKSAANSSQQAADTAAASEQEKLDYLKQINALPIELRDKALKQLGDYFQVPGQPKDQGQLIQDALSSPLYSSIMGTEKAGENAVLRTAGATGFKRSGNSVGALTDYGQQTANRALLESYNEAKTSDLDKIKLNLGGISGLAGLNTGTTDIANTIADIGKTKAAGITAGAQAEQQGSQNGINNLLGIAGLGIQAYGNGLIKI